MVWWMGRSVLDDHRLGGRVHAVLDADDVEAVGLLAEVHDGAELERALRLPTNLIGVNNRNLKTLDVDITMTEALAGAVPDDRVLISESGLYTPAHLVRMAMVGVNSGNCSNWVNRICPSVRSNLDRMPWNLNEPCLT